MRYLILLNDPPYGTERSYNGLRLALQLRKQEGVELTVFLMADAVFCAKAGQKTPDGFYNARGLAETDLMPGVHRSSMDELTAWTMAADKVIVF